MTSNADNQKDLEQKITSSFSIPTNESKPTEKVEKKVEEKVIPTPKSERVLLNTTDAYIHDRMQSQPKSLDEVETSVEVSEENITHQLTLPKELDDYKNRLRFRWLSKDKRQIDRACDVRGWVIANRTHFPNLPDHLFTVSGSIERGDMILSFIKKEIGDKMFEDPGKKSKDIVQGAFEKHKDDPRYYRPKEGGENVIQI